MTKSQYHDFTADSLDENLRLDRFLFLKHPAASRSRFKELIKQGFVSASGRTITDPNHRVKSGDDIRVEIPAPAPAQPQAEHIALEIAYEDDHVVVIDKPAGLVVHPAPGNWTGTLVNALIAHCGESLSGIGGVRRPGIVHRLDKDTSGLMVAAKTDRAHIALAQQFAAHGRDGRLERIYTALVWNRFERAKGTIDTLIARGSANRKKMAVPKDAAKGRSKRAITHYQVVSELPAKGDTVISIVECRLETGRTHQIRVHLTKIGHPVVNDLLYGAGFKTSIARLNPAAQAAVQTLGRQALHAAILGFEHPVTGEALRFEAPLPPEFKAVITACGATG